MYLYELLSPFFLILIIICKIRANEDIPAEDLNVEELLGRILTPEDYKDIEIEFEKSGPIRSQNIFPKILSGPTTRRPQRIQGPPQNAQYQQGTENRPQFIQRPGDNQNGNENPNKNLNEYQLLLSAIESLARKFEKMEARVKTVESVILYLANKNKVEDTGKKCPQNYSRIDGIKGKCFYISSLDNRQQVGQNVGDWKTSAGLCERSGGKLVELPNYSEYHRLVQFLTKNTDTRISANTDFWTGGLNPGLIWLWSASGQQIDQDKRFWNENDNSTKAPGCLKLSYSNRLDTFYFKGTPCNQAQNFICEITAP